MNKALSRERKRRILVFLLAALAWLLGVALAWAAADAQAQRRQTVLLGKAAASSPEEGEALLRLMREPEQAEDEEQGREVLARAGYGSQGARFLLPDRQQLLFGALAAGGAAVLALLYCWMQRGSRRRRREMARLIQWMQEEEGDLPAFRTSEALALGRNVGVWSERMRLRKRQVEEDRKAMQASLENISHQMKTPLAGVQLYLETLLRQTQASESRELLSQCHEKLEQLQGMIGSLLNLARLESGRARRNMDRLPVAALVDQAAEDLQAEWEARELSLLTEIPRELTVVVDGFWLRQAFLNVLRNSVQHTPSGGTIRCRGWEEGESVVVEIADTGSGIAREEEEKIFERFYRPQEDAASGSGIGLHLARQILEQQGGRLQVRQVEKGACFRFTFTALSGKNKRGSEEGIGTN